MSKILIILGSVREGRITDTILERTLSELHTQGYTDEDIDVADPKKMALPFFNETTVPIYAHGKYKNQDGTQWAQRVLQAEKVLILSPEYNYSAPAVLKNLIDWVYDGWLHKPVAIITWGVNGGLDAYANLQHIMNKLPANLVAGGHLMLQDIQEKPSIIAYRVASVIESLKEVADDGTTHPGK